MTQGPDSLNQFLVLTLDNSAYALPVLSVVEVLRMVAVRPLPESPVWIAGVLNLRGRGVIVMDLRARLGLPSQSADPGAQIVIVAAASELLGLIADDVSEIIALPPASLRPADSRTSPSRMVSAVAHAADRLILVLDIDRLADAGVELGAAHARS